MIRVGFFINFSEKTWIGGINYYENLLNALYSLKDRSIEPVIFTGSKADLNAFRGFPPVKIVRTRLLDASLTVIRNGYKLVFTHDLFLKRLLARHGISLYHSITADGNAGVPALGWIPDFQHRRLPDFFTAEERRARDQGYKKICDSSALVIVSSFSALSDLNDFAPEAVSKARVLRFVAGVSEKETPGAGELERRYGFKAPYFHVPNQFWAHKNHRVIIDALGLLKKSGRNTLVLATGNTHDYRQPEYFNELMAYAGESGVLDNFKPLGIIPRPDAVALMRGSIALINPSLFEGWSTSVEEAKSMGKRIILSDIPVHREQDPPGGTFFDPKDPKGLAEAMWGLASRPDPDAERLKREAAEKLPGRRSEFARRFEETVFEALGKKGRAEAIGG